MVLWDVRRPFAVMMLGEGNDEILGASRSQLLGTDRAMPQVGVEASRRREVKQLETRGQAAANDAKSGVALTDVVEQCSPGQASPPGSHRQDAPRRFETVPLVGRRLSPEEIPFEVPQQRGYLGLLARR